MENLDFGSSDVGLLIQERKADMEPSVPEEKKEDLHQMNMMEFSSSIDDLMPPASAGPTQMDQYSNPTSGRITGIALPTPTSEPKKSTNPFNLTDDQYQAVIAAIVGAIVFSTSVQTKLAGIVPNFNGINGTVASAIVIAIAFYFAKKYIMKK